MRLTDAIQGYNISSLADGYSPNTIKVYTSALGIMSEYLGDPDVTRITEVDLKKFFGHLQTVNPEHSDNDILSTASLHRYWKSVRSFWKWAEVELKTPRPDLNFRMPKNNNKEIIPYSEDEVQRLLKACQTSPFIQKKNMRGYRIHLHLAERNAAIVLLLLDTGNQALPHRQNSPACGSIRQQLQKSIVEISHNQGRPA
jgi:integrase